VRRAIGADATVAQARQWRLKREDARGRCLNGGNRSLAVGESKMGVFRRYRFCFAIENSIAHDYVSEKLWDAFAAGCVPIYYVRPFPLRQYVISIDSHNDVLTAPAVRSACTS